MDGPWVPQRTLLNSGKIGTEVLEAGGGLDLGALPARVGGCLVWSALDSELAPGPMLFQAEAPKRTPVATPARPPTAQEVCYLRAQQAQRGSASWLQAAPRPTERLSSVHISAPGEKRRIAHVPNPRLAASKSWPHPFLDPLPWQVQHSENLCCTWLQVPSQDLGDCGVGTRRPEGLSSLLVPPSPGTISRTCLGLPGVDSSLNVGGGMVLSALSGGPSQAELLRVRPAQRARACDQEELLDLCSSLPSKGCSAPDSVLLFMSTAHSCVSRWFLPGLLGHSLGDACGPSCRRAWAIPVQGLSLSPGRLPRSASVPLV